MGSGTNVVATAELTGKSGIMRGTVKTTLEAQGMPYQDNKSDQVAYRNCTCGHHWNYHK
jgi:hypothetical protein